MKPWDSIGLTDEEKEEALIEWRKRKYFKAKNKPYWDAQESKKGTPKKTRIQELLESDPLI